MNTSFEVLNKILQGEHLAIEQYQGYIEKLPDGPLRNHLAAILTDHKNHATRIAYYIQTNGGQAEEGAGLLGIVADWKTRLDNIGEATPEEILEHLYDGENKGLARAVQYSEQCLNSSDNEVLQSIFSNEREHLKQLQSLKEGAYNNM